MRSYFYGMTIVLLLAAVIYILSVSVVRSEQYVVDYGNGYGQNVDSETHFPVGTAYLISTPTVIQTAPGEVIGGGYTYRPVSIRDQIIDAARRYHVNVNCMLNIAWRESKYDPTAVGDHGDAIGIFQFHSQLWSRTPQGRAGLSRYDASANIEAAAWVMSNPNRDPNMGYQPWRGC